MRSSGILLHISSLDSDYGIGTFGKSAFDFIDFLKDSGQEYWQVLPLGPTGYGDSPYQSFSTFAGNPYFIDLTSLREGGLLTEEEIKKHTKNSGRVDYGFLYKNRLPLLKIAYSRFVPDDKFSVFCLENEYWLTSFANFMALKEANCDKPLGSWKTKNASTNAVGFYKFLQFLFMEQWFSLKNYANQKGIKIIGDIPIYVSIDSADVFAEPEQFLLDENLRPTLVAGCPPDAFSATGQLWGNPLYNWEQMKKDDYAWWKRRLAFSFRLYDVVRIDHFRGFESFYAIPFGSKTAETGSWIKGPGTDFFDALKKHFGSLPVIAEDLGFLTENVREMLRHSGFPGMKVLQFAFDTRENGDYLPHNYTKNSVCYTGTHDNNTIMGWLKEAPSAALAHAKNYLFAKSDKEMAEAMIRSALSSVSALTILMLPDLLFKDETGRINTPSSLGGNWEWRVKTNEITEELSNKIYGLTKLYGRI